MIRTEMSRCPLPVSGGVEHAAEAGRVDRPAVYTEADQAPRALVHDHEHPVALEHDGLAAKQVDAPETVRRVTDERQPGRPGAARGGSIVFRQHASDDVLVDVDAERPRDDACNAWTAEPRISRFELNDRPDERVARPLRSGRPRAMARREQAPVLPMHQRPMKRQQCRGADANGDLSEPPRPEKEGPESAEKAVDRGQVRCPLPRSTQDDQLLLQQEILRDHGSHAAGPTELCGRDGQVEQGEHDSFHTRDSVGDTIGGTQRCLRPAFSERIGNSRRTG